MTDKIVILCTCSCQEEAGSLARSLVEAHLAACVSVIPQVQSYYYWKGALESSNECLLMIKSSQALFEELRSHLVRLHSYEVPEILAIPVSEGSPDYLHWLDTSLARSGGPA
jgi:periplasmic divalent cation tolerance protein